MYNLISIGDPLIDTHVFIDDAAVECELSSHQCQLCLDYGGKVPIVNSFQALGGNACNVAVGAKKLGLKTAIIGAVGADSNGQWVTQELKKFKVDTNYITLDKKNKTRYSVVLNFQGERTILSYSQKKQYIWPQPFPQTDWIYYSALSRGFEPLQKKLINHLRQHPNIKLAVNPGSYALKYARPELREVIARANLLVVNKEEAEKILETKKPQPLPTLLNNLLRLGAREVVVTNAGQGAWAGDAEQIWHLNSYPVKVVAKTGAGDAFSSGYVVARYLKQTIPQALQWGIANSCGVITKLGAQNGLLNKAGIKKMIGKFPNIKPTMA